jgi:phage protein D
MQIIYKGKDIYPSISVTACEHTMYAESQADSLVLRFNDTSRQWDGWKVEQEETIEIIEGAARTGKMFIYDVTPANGVYTLKAFSIPPTSKNRTSKSWEKVHFKQLCKEVAERHGLSYEEHGVTDQVYEYVVQNNLPDFVFLDQRCKLEGCAFLVFDGKLVVYSEAALEATSPQMLLTLDTEADFNYSDNTAKSYKSAEVVNGSRTGTHAAATESGSRVLHKNISIPMTNQAEANRFAKNLLRLENKNQRAGVISWDIQRELAPGSVLQLKTQGAKSWDGSAFIYKIRHDYIAERSKIFVRKPLKY